MRFSGISIVAATLLLATPAAGAPFQTDDPEPVDTGAFELAVFAEHIRLEGVAEGEAGFDFAYGLARDLELGLVVPVAFEDPDGATAQSGLGNVEIGLKYRILHQEQSGWDLALAPAVLLPADSELASDHAAFGLSAWAGRTWGRWTMFGGGGCTLNRGGDSQDYCSAGAAAVYGVTPRFELGAELFHEQPDAEDGQASTTLGLGMTYDLIEHVQLQAYLGAGLQNTDDAGRNRTYIALQFAF